VDRHETSLNKKSSNQPSHLKKLTMLQTNEDFKTTKFNLPKTAATTSNKTEHFLPNSNKTINQEPLTQKQINTHHVIVDPLNYDKKYLAKQLLSQIHFCRFLFKLILRMNDKLPEEVNEDLLVLKEYMSGLIFDKLTEVEELKMVNPKYMEDFQNCSDFNKIEQIILQYQSKYARDLVPLRQISKPLVVMKEQLHKNVINLYSYIE
jgi:hypothetical protein